MTSVWPALCPPWNLTTTSAWLDSQSTILPLPSSPHWAPTTTTFAMSEVSLLYVPRCPCKRPAQMQNPGARPGFRGRSLQALMGQCGPKVKFSDSLVARVNGSDHQASPSFRGDPQGRARNPE